MADSELTWSISSGGNNWSFTKSLLRVVLPYISLYPRLVLALTPHSGTFQILWSQLYPSWLITPQERLTKRLPCLTWQVLFVKWTVSCFIAFLGTVCYGIQANVREADYCISNEWMLPNPEV